MKFLIVWHMIGYGVKMYLIETDDVQYQELIKSSHTVIWGTAEETQETQNIMQKLWDKLEKMEPIFNDDQGMLESNKENIIPVMQGDVTIIYTGQFA